MILTCRRSPRYGRAIINMNGVQVVGFAHHLPWKAPRLFKQYANRLSHHGILTGALLFCDQRLQRAKAFIRHLDGNQRAFGRRRAGPGGEYLNENACP